MRSWAGLALLLVLCAGCGRTAKLTRGDTAALALAQAAVELLAEGDRPGAIEKLNAAIQRYPLSYELRFEYARVASNSRFTAPALDTFALLMDEDPSDLDVPRNYARLAIYLGQLDRASEPIARLMASSNPTSADYTVSASLAFALGDSERARQTAGHAIAQDDSNAEAYSLLGKSIIEAGGDDAEALAALATAIGLNPGLGSARYAYGTLMIQTGDEGGRGELERWKTCTSLKGADFKRSEIAQRLSNSKEASRVIPEWSTPWIEIARAQLELGQPRKAQESLAIAFKALPVTNEMYKLSYSAARAQNDTKNAELWLKRWTRARQKGTFDANKN
jgi:tetratricopeptide (TPR) repeat protein